MAYRLTPLKIRTLDVVWKQLAKDYYGKFKHYLATSPAIIDPVTSEHHCFELKIPHKNRIIEFTSSEQNHFKVYYQFNKKLNLTIDIYKEDFIEKISKLFGLKEIEIGDKDFDNEYIIKSNNPETLLNFFEPEITSGFQKFKVYNFRLYKERGYELRIVPFMNEDNIEEMSEFIRFVKSVIDKLY